VLSIQNLQQHSAVFTKLLLHPDMLDSLEDLMQGSVVLHHTKAHMKPPKDGSPFPTHQDYHYFPYKKHSMLAVLIHLDDTDSENGGLGVFPGSHKQGPQTDASNTAGVHYLDLEKWPLSSAIPVHAKAGDVPVFSYLLIHGSYPNISDKIRRIFLIQVAEGSDVSTSGKHRSPGSGMVLRGTNLSMTADLDKRHQEGEEQELK
jgi:phytanoyl-CoA hydroxylase